MFDLRMFKIPSDIEVRDVMSSFSLTTSLRKHSWQDIENLTDQIKRISIRDTFELNIDLDGVDHTISAVGEEALNQLKEHYLEHSEEDETLSIELKINKQQDKNIISIYNLKEFTKYLTAQSTLKNIELLSYKIHGAREIIFEVFEEVENFGSETIKFVKHDPDGKIISSKAVISRDKTLDLFKENTVLTGLPYLFIAEDFHTVQGKHLHGLEDFFKRAKIVYSLACLSNSTEVNAAGEIRFRFNGYKSFLTKFLPPEKISENEKIAYKIYAWTFSDGHCADKLGLVRNILTLNNQKDRLNLTTSTWHTIQSNYEIYLKENIAQYLELKGKLLEFISDFSKRAFDATDTFIGSFQSSAAAFVTFIISVVAINGLKDSGADKIFSKEYFLISAFICIASTLWLLLSRTDTKDRIVHITSQTKKSIIDNYKNILSLDELNDGIDPAIESIKTHTNNRIKKYTWLWTSTILTFLLIFATGLIFSDSKKTEEKNNTPDSDTPAQITKPKKQEKLVIEKLLRA